METFVSVIIPARNAQSTIGPCIDALMAQEYPAFEVIIVDDLSDDATARIVERRQDRYGRERLRLVRNGDRTGPSRVRNAALADARGGLVAYTDADCVVGAGWLKTLAACFEDPDVAGAGGVQLSPDDDTVIGRAVHSYMSIVGFMTDYMKQGGDAAVVETGHNPSCNVMYRKEVLERNGGFREGMWPGEDVELDLRIRRAGGKLVFTSAAAVYHYRPKELGRFRDMMFRYGRAQGMLAREFGFFRKLHFVAPLFAAAVLGFLALYVIRPLLAWAALLAFVCVNAAYFFLKKRTMRAAWGYTLLHLVTLAAWNTGFVVGFARGKKA